MDCYDIWVDLRPGHPDLRFADDLATWMTYLRSRGLIEGYRLTRRKLGFGPDGLGEFHVRIETKDLAQLESAFQRAATRDKEAEAPHAAVYAAVTNFKAGLYRDFPDAVRVR